MGGGANHGLGGKCHPHPLKEILFTEILRDILHHLQLWKSLYWRDSEEAGSQNEHEDACKKGMTEKPAIAKHVWNSNHPIVWNETAVVDQARGGKELLIKEALHIRLTPEDQCFNRDGGLELPGCWVVTLKAQNENHAHEHQEIDLSCLTFKGVVIFAHVY